MAEGCRGGKVVEVLLLVPNVYTYAKPEYRKKKGTREKSHTCLKKHGFLMRKKGEERWQLVQYLFRSEEPDMRKKD